MSVRIFTGDCRELLRTLPDASVDSVVTDPPAGIGFMGREWDGDKGGRDAWIGWMQQVASECLRVLKPGGHALVWAIPRTSHWTATAWENAGFEVRDRIAHIFGSGFPKSVDVSKAIDRAAGAERIVTRPGQTKAAEYAGQFDQADSSTRERRDLPATEAAKQWTGWGTALKPAMEDWWLLRKPLRGTIAANVLAHSTGALNVNACRIPTDDSLNGGAYSVERKPSSSEWVKTGGTIHSGTGRDYVQPVGRWPANVLTDGSDEVVAAFPDAPGQQAEISTTAPSAKTSRVYGAMRREGEASADRVYSESGATNFALKPGARRLDEGSAARFFYAAKPSTEERNIGLEHPGVQFSMGSTLRDAEKVQAAKRGNYHPTVKPLALMQYLVRLVTPPGGTVLDPFAGSGTTGIAADREGFDAVLIEQDPEYADLARRRISGDSPLFAEVA